jgi:alpha-tubulin suppressor-like RCC1 family protein
LRRSAWSATLQRLGRRRYLLASYASYLLLCACTDRLSVLGPEPLEEPEAPSCRCDDREVCSATGCIRRGDLNSLGLGYRFSCGIVHGVLSCWGDNRYGQLGNNYPILALTPQPVDAHSDWIAVDGAEEHVCAIQSPGQLFCWGSNGGGQLGTADNSPKRSPARVRNLDGILRVSCGGSVSCAIRSNGGLYCWGANVERLFPDVGDLATGIVDRPLRVLPNSEFRRVSLGSEHGCAIRTDGVLLCWGKNSDGQVGVGDVSDEVMQPTQVGDHHWYEVSAGSRHTCAIRTDYALFCWGNNLRLQLGLGENWSARSQPERVGDESDWQSVSAGDAHTCGTRDDRLYCWGYNASGQTGHWVSDPFGQPTLVDGMSGFDQVAAGQSHTCALDDDEVYCWGSNQEGQLGNNDHMTRYEPTPVTKTSP